MHDRVEKFGHFFNQSMEILQRARNRMANFNPAHFQMYLKFITLMATSLRTMKLVLRRYRYLHKRTQAKLRFVERTIREHIEEGVEEEA